MTVRAVQLRPGDTVRIPGRGWHRLTDAEWNGQNVVMARWGKRIDECEPFWVTELVDVA